MKTLILLFLLLLNPIQAYALIGTTTTQIFDLTNPSGADIDSPVVDVSERAGYSIHCAITGALEMTASIYVSNQKIISPAQTQVFTLLSDTTLVINSDGFMWDVVKSKVGYVKLRIGTFSGTGTLKCYLTAKDS